MIKWRLYVNIAVNIENSEMRAKLPYGKGMRPVFWLLGDNYNTKKGAKVGRFDVMEFIDSTPYSIYGTIRGNKFHIQGKYK